MSTRPEGLSTAPRLRYPMRSSGCRIGAFSIDLEQKEERPGVLVREVLALRSTRREGDMSDMQGNFVWYELMTSDVNGAIKFYKDVVGWGTQSFEGGETPYSMWTVGQTPIGGVLPLPDEAKKMGAPPHWIA